MMIPMSSPDITQAERDAVLQVLQTAHLSMGPQIEEFERCFATTVGNRNAVAVSSGTAALHLAVIAADIGRGDLVITSPFSFVASANCLLYEDAVPIFVDVDPATGNIDPERATAAAAAIAEGSPVESKDWLPPSIERTGAGLTLRGFLPVHAFGQPADMRPLVDTARRRNLVVIEDACEAIGAEYEGRAVGTIGDAAAFAFYPNKQMTTAEGGMLVTGRSDWDGLYRSLRNQGRDDTDGWLNHSRLGYNYRLDELSAALGLVQLQRLPDLLEKRAKVASWYSERLSSVDHVHIPLVAPTTTRMSWFVYCVRLDPPIDRNSVMSSLKAEGIPSRAYFSPIHLQPFYVSKFGYKPGTFPIAEALGRQCLALPFSSIMTEGQVATVCEKLEAVVRRLSLSQQVYMSSSHGRHTES